jgi:hypothetical protein
MFVRTLKTRTGRWDLLISTGLLTHNKVTTTDNAGTVMSLIVQWVSLLADSPLCITSGLKPRKLFRDFFRELTTQPIEVSILKYTTYYEEIMGIGSEDPPSLLQGNSQTGKFCSGILRSTPIAKEYIAWQKSGDPKVLQYIMSFLAFGRKTPIINEDLFEVSLRDWIDTEKGISELELDTTLCSRLKSVLATILSVEDHGYVPYRMKHGSGYVAERIRDLSLKILSLKGHPRLDRAFQQENEFSGNPQDSVDCLPRDWLPRESALDMSEDTSRIKDIYKTYKTSRLICMEPAAFMLAQQSVLWLLLQSIEHGYASNFIDLKYQEHNQDAAREGSITGHVDTIDMKRASDTVSYELVKHIFPRKLLYYMSASRTTKVLLPDGSIFNVEKFAPMGSAVCFPTQCIIFLGAMLLEYLRYSCVVNRRDLDDVLSSSDETLFFLRNIISRKASRDKLAQPVVYGDDLVCDFRITGSYMQTLKRLGFQVNETKSFLSNHAFRESCGKYYWLGNDVTPTIFKQKVIAREGWDAKSLMSAVAACNRSGAIGYSSIRTSQIQLIRHIPIIGWPKGRPRGILFKKIPVVSNNEEQDKISGMWIYSTQPHNGHLSKRVYQDGNQPIYGKRDRRSSCVKYMRDETYALSLLDVEKPWNLGPLNDVSNDRQTVEGYLYNQKQLEYHERDCYDTRYDCSSIPGEISQGNKHATSLRTRIAMRWTPSL